MKRFFSKIQNVKLKTTPGVSRRDSLFLVIMLAVFATLSLINIGASSVWFDESFSAYIIRFNFAEIWQFTAADVHPPLYYWALKIWSALFGTTDVALRSMSVLWGGVAILMAYLLLLRSFGRKAAMYGIAALAVSPILIRYSQEMRMYTMVAAIGLAATYAMVRASEAKAGNAKKWWTVYGVLISLGMWTHYFSAIIWLAHWVWRLGVTIRQKNKTKKVAKAFFSKDWVRAHVLAVVLFLPWLPMLVKQLFIVQVYGFWIPPVSPLTILNYFTNTVVYLDQNGLTPWLTLGFIVLVVAVIYMHQKGYKTLTKPQRQVYFLLVALALVPPVLLLVMSMPPLRSSFVDRYLVLSSLVVSILLGMAAFYSLKQKKRWMIIVMHGMVAGASVIGILNVYTYGNYNKTTSESSGAKQVMSQILEKASIKEPIVASSMWLYYDAVVYETEANPVQFFDTGKYPYSSLDMLKLRPKGKITNKDDFLKAHSTFWYVGRPGEKMLEAPAANLEIVQTIEQSDPFTKKPAYRAAQYKVLNEE